MLDMVYYGVYIIEVIRSYMDKQDKIMKAIKELSEDEEAIKYINDGFKRKQIHIKFLDSEDKVLITKYSSEDDFSDEGF